jgi:hypothetical protein
MISNKTDGIIQLIKSQNIAIIKELFDVSFFTEELFMSSLRTCFSIKNSSFDTKFIVEIINLIANNFGDENLKQDKYLVDCLISKIKFKKQNYIDDSICFRKLTDMGGTVDDEYNFIMNNIPNDDFFYYAANNKIKINAYTLSFVVGGRERISDERIHNWLFEQWESRDIEFDLQQLSNLVTSAHYRNEKTYLTRIMQKICQRVNIEIIITYVLINCQYVDEIDKIMEYASECVHENELLMLVKIKTHWAAKKPDRYVKKDEKLMKTDDIKSLIAKDKKALEIYKKIIVTFDNLDGFNVNTQFDGLLDNLILFTTMINT